MRVILLLSLLLAVGGITALVLALRTRKDEAETRRERVVVRQELVRRCDYCDALTPVDLRACDECGAKLR
jgi:hypothetical protein